MEPILGLLALVVFIVLAVILGHWTLGPINRAAGDLKAPTKFLLTDFIWLMVQLQIALAVAVPYWTDTMVGRYVLVLIGVTCFLVVVLWAGSVAVLSRAGIVAPLRRAVVILLIVPAALLIVMMLPLTLLIFALSLFGVFLPGLHLGWATVGMTAGSALGLAVASYVIRLLSAWVIRAPTDPTPLSSVAEPPLT